jgi:triphosphoribosyl-dephospho-CoA synthase
MKVPREIARLAQMACILEVCASKPGNVTRQHDFPETSMLDFLLSAVAIGPAFENSAQLSVGAIVSQAIQDTRQSVKTNTNLGIVLLLAPLAKSSYGAANLGDIRRNLNSILKNLSVEDARLAYSAIRLAKAGGMHRVLEADISEEPSITLLQAMALAQDRDTIAREYATGFTVTFEIGLPALEEATSRGAELHPAIVQTYLTILGRVPDTLIARKKGEETARIISMQAAEVLNEGGVFTSNGQKAILEMDRGLRDPAHALNPGTTADLTTAAIFLSLLKLEV